jgi:uncharacterized membrane protein
MTLSPTARTLRRPALLLGLALGGFFDGILLHQILQWHHLLSSVAAARDLRVQILADGLFHAGMYAVAAWALAALWRRRSAVDEAVAGRALWAWALIGFGAWHIADGVLSHWVIGLHRVKMDAANPLAWDLAWFIAFGVLPLLAGWWALRGRDAGGTGAGPHGGGSGGQDGRRRAGPGGDPRPGRAHGRAVASGLAAAAVLAAPVSALPPAMGNEAVVLFAPGVSPAVAFDALARAEARVRWVDASGGLWAVQMPDAAAVRRLYRDGALLVSRSAIGLGCLSWARAGS